MRYRVDLVYRNKYIKEVNVLMNKLDLDVGEIGIKQAFTFTSNANKPVDVFRKAIIQAFESQELEILDLQIWVNDNE